MNIALIAIVFFILLAILLLILFLSKSINKNKFIADDGSVFKNESDLDDYQALYEKTKPLFSGLEDIAPNQEILGFEKIFLTKLTGEGFKDLKSIVKYGKQFALLSDLINT